MKATLEEMATACDRHADRTITSLHAAEQFHPQYPRDEPAHREASVLQSAAELLRILGTYEDESRKFVGGLIERHKR